MCRAFSTQCSSVNTNTYLYAYSTIVSSECSPPTSGGDLSYHLEKEGRFQVPRVRLYIAQLALALQYLKGKLIIHRDVKPANMLLDSQVRMWSTLSAMEP